MSTLGVNLCLLHFFSLDLLLQWNLTFMGVILFSLADNSFGPWCYCQQKETNKNLSELSDHAKFLRALECIKHLDNVLMLQLPQYLIIRNQHPTISHSTSLKKNNNNNQQSISIRHTSKQQQHTVAAPLLQRLTFHADCSQMKHTPLFPVSGYQCLCHSFHASE
jgi:hypothetical protein